MCLLVAQSYEICRLDKNSRLRVLALYPVLVIGMGGRGIGGGGGGGGELSHAWWLPNLHVMFLITDKEWKLHKLYLSQVYQVTKF